MDNMDNHLTVAEIAKLYKKSRQTVYNAIKNGKLSAKNEEVDGQETTLIELSELIRVWGEPNNKKTKRKPINPEATTEDITISSLAIENAELKAKLAGAEALQKQTERLISNAEAERDRAIQQVSDWQKQAEISQKLLTDEREKNEKPKSSWWKRFINN